MWTLIRVFCVSLVSLRSKKEVNILVLLKFSKDMTNNEITVIQICLSCNQERRYKQRGDYNTHIIDPVVTHSGNVTVPVNVGFTFVAYKFTALSLDRQTL